MKRSKREPQKLVPILRELGYRIREVYAPTSDRLKPRPGDSALSPQSLSDSRIRADQPGPATGRPRDPRQPGLPRQQDPYYAQAKVSTHCERTVSLRVIDAESAAQRRACPRHTSRSEGCSSQDAASSD